MAQLKDLIVTGAGRIIGKLYATSFKGDGAEITGLNASNVSSGTLSSDRLPIATSSELGGVMVGNGLSIDSFGLLSSSSGSSEWVNITSDVNWNSPGSMNGYGAFKNESLKLVNVIFYGAYNGISSVGYTSLNKTICTGLPKPITHKYGSNQFDFIGGEQSSSCGISFYKCGYSSNDGGFITWSSHYELYHPVGNWAYMGFNIFYLYED